LVPEFAARNPLTWHYGLVAGWWAEFNLTGPEIAYFRRFVESDGQPALDVACGTGRLLVPFLRAGLDVDGSDISPDMLALCRERMEREGFSTNLYAQAMHELELPRKYRTIIVCGGFGLGGNRDQDRQALRRFHDHLEPGGLLVLDNEVPYADASQWRYWLEPHRRDLPETWPPPGPRRRASDGTEYELRSRIVDLEPLSQRLTLEMRASMWRDGRLVAEEEHILRLTLYFTHELLMMLEAAGFSNVAMRADHTDSEPTDETKFVVFVARKSSEQSQPVSGL
jgi:ubiquinone/menaquinone biosynthesis C-methylase UbiE